LKTPLFIKEDSDDITKKRKRDAAEEGEDVGGRVA
jgi:hypothetical protein